MEKKTIGSFIAALRRANGLTQRQLADKLCVSDKAVSRWERDEALPDLSLIPELSDIFGVTADEILRGERQNPESCSSPTSSEKGEKLRKRLLAKKKRNFSILSTISIGISVLGVINAMLYSFAFGSPTDGFFFSLAFFTVSVVFQVSAIIGNLSDLDEEMITQAERIARNEHTLKLAFGSFLTTFLLMMFCSMPLLMSNFDNWGLQVNVWVNIYIVCGIVGLCVGWIIYLLINTRLQKRGIILIAPRKLTLNKLKVRYLSVFLLILVVIFIGQVFSLILINNIDISRVKFNNWDDFKEYVERPILRSGMQYELNEIKDENISVEYIYDDSGNVLCSFYYRNFAVFGWEYNQNDDGTWLIEVADLTRINRGYNIMNRLVMPALLLMYPFVAFATYIVYRKKAKKL